jgi:hypothetical protein
MMKPEALRLLDTLNEAVEKADAALVENLALDALPNVMDCVIVTPEIAHAERQAKARIGYLDRAIRSNGAAPPTGDIEKLRRRAGRAVVALRDLLDAASLAVAEAPSA